MPSLTKQFELFLKLRNVCTHKIPIEINPSDNMCKDSGTSMCDMSVCPLIKSRNLPGWQ